jgi:hypothetical protein
MAMSKRAPKRRTGRSSGIDQTLRDARDVLGDYINSGGKQVKDTLNALLRIFHMDTAGESGAARGRRRTRTGTAKRARRTSTKQGGAPARAQKRARPSRKAVGKSEATPRQAAVSRRGATRRSKRTKSRAATTR